MAEKKETKKPAEEKAAKKPASKASEKPYSTAGATERRVGAVICCFRRRLPAREQSNQPPVSRPRGIKAFIRTDNGPFLDL